MATIFEFAKPVVPGVYHRFLLLQNDAGEFTDIARGGPESAAAGSNGLTSGGVGSAAGLGNIVANVESYSPLS